MDRNLRLSNTASWLIILSLLVVSLVYFRSLIEPFVLAVFIWYLIRAARNGISKIRIRGKSFPRWLQVTLAFLITFSVLWGFWEILSYNINLIIKKSSDYSENLQSMIQGFKLLPIFEDLPGAENFDDFLIENLSKLDIQSYVGNILNSLSFIVGNFALIVVYVIFLLIEENFIPAKINVLTKSTDRKENVSKIIRQISQSVNTYFSVKTSMSLLTGVLSFLVMLMLGVDFAVLWAFLIFLFNYIPYVGSLIATLLPAIFAIFQFASFWPFLWVFLSVEAVQILVGNYIEPKVMGKTLNLSPLIVVMALSFWGAIWGVVGMILSVPIVSVIVIVMSHFPATKGVAILFSEQGNLDSYGGSANQA
ncbi:MAG: AI-2E family transporter [Cyclobacteriaceae bacterium]|nr:AI-2E family transporter [Cyclobacteriaceae bacterium HetDA_MAG_MS6]